MSRWKSPWTFDLVSILNRHQCYRTSSRDELERRMKKQNKKEFREWPNNSNGRILAKTWPKNSLIEFYNDGKLYVLNKILMIWICHLKFRIQLLDHRESLADVLFTYKENKTIEASRWLILLVTIAAIKTICWISIYLLLTSCINIMKAYSWESISEFILLLTLWGRNSF